MYKFIKEPDKNHQFDKNRIEYSVGDATWPALLEEFKYFLKGCGFLFDDSDYNLRCYGIESDNSDFKKEVNDGKDKQESCKKNRS